MRGLYEEDPMSAELRRYPRFTLHIHGTVALTEGQGNEVDVDVECVSCEGAGVSVVGQPTRAVLPGSLIELRFAVPDAEVVVLPARVVWAAAGKAGLRFRLSECDADSKHRFAAWIAPRTKQALAEARASGRSRANTVV